MKTYAILVRENHPGASLVELCRCSSNPEQLMRAAQTKTLLLDGGKGRKVRVPKYEHVEIREVRP